jgi:uncharacterized protein YndB with AHSA1/START domain
LSVKSISWRLHLPVPPAIVFRALDTNEGRAKFWAETAVERDGIIHFEFVNGQTWNAHIVERRAPSTFAIDYFGAIARFELTDDGEGGTELLLTHVGVPETDWLDTHAGWLNVLLPLKAWLLTGVDIRNHDAKRTWDHGYGDQ